MQPHQRERIEALVELLIDLLDQADGDIDFELEDNQIDDDDEGAGWRYPAHMPGGNGVGLMSARIVRR